MSSCCLVEGRLDGQGRATTQGVSGRLIRRDHHRSVRGTPSGMAWLLALGDLRMRVRIANPRVMHLDDLNKTGTKENRQPGTSLWWVRLDYLENGEVVMDLYAEEELMNIEEVKQDDALRSAQRVQVDSRSMR